MTARTRLPAALALALGVLVSSPAYPAAAELVLVDGQVLEGVDVTLRGDDYALTLATGDVLTIPKALVTELRLRDAGEDRSKEAPSGIVVAEPEVLVGPSRPEPLPRLHDQLAAFAGGTSTFSRSVVDPTWRPSEVPDLASTLDRFEPSTWYRAPIDPTWTPTPAFTRASDVTAFNPVRWSKGIEREPWWPRDGFRERRESAARLFGESAD